MRGGGFGSDDFTVDDELIYNYAIRQEKGLRGKSSALEKGNPQSGWLDATYNTYINKFILVMSVYQADKNGKETGNALFLLTSSDGIHWGERVRIAGEAGAELQYPTIVGKEEGQRETGQEFYVYYTFSRKGSEDGRDRWEDAEFRMLTIKLK